MIPLLASCGWGVVLGWSLFRPASIRRWLRDVFGVFGLLLIAEVSSSWALGRWFSRDVKSDVRGPLAFFAGIAICVGLAAPLATWLASRDARVPGPA